MEERMDLPKQVWEMVGLEGAFVLRGLVTIALCAKCNTPFFGEEEQNKAFVLISRNDLVSFIHNGCLIAPLN